jgi:hypothetical protein
MIVSDSEYDDSNEDSIAPSHQEGEILQQMEIVLVMIAIQQMGIVVMMTRTMWNMSVQYIKGEIARRKHLWSLILGKDVTMSLCVQRVRTYL